MHHSSLAILATSFALALSAPIQAQQGQAAYRLTFQTTWSTFTHPVQFPGNPHYSPLIGSLHTPAVEFWAPGGIASPGIESMAETGATTTLAGEMAAQIGAGHVDKVINLGPLNCSPCSLTATFTADASHPLLTLVSMLAPSPDWFVGVHGLPLIQNGDWVDNLVVPLNLYDAGTDSGVSYNSGNSNTNPQDPIALVTTASGPFAGASTQVGTFTLQRLHSNVLYGCGVNGNHTSVAVDGQARIGQTVMIGTYPGDMTFPMPAVSGLALSTSAAAGFPCGVQFPELGLVAGTPGEVLLGSIDALIVGPVWNGGMTTWNIPLPSQASLVGQSFYLQGVYAADRVGLTDAVVMHVGT